MKIAGCWAIVFLGCGAALPPPSGKLTTGPEFASPPRRLLALPATCIEENRRACVLGVCADMPALCREGHTRALETLVAINMDFLDYHLIDSEQISARLAEQRWQTTVTSSNREASQSTERQTIERINWNQALPEEREFLLEDLQVQGFLAASVSLAHGGPMEVRVTVSTRDGVPVWESRCGVENWQTRADTIEHQMQDAAYCALQGAALPW